MTNRRDLKTPPVADILSAVIEVLCVYQRVTILSEEKKYNIINA